MSEYCGVQITEPGSFELARDKCCPNESSAATSSGDCDSSKRPKGPAFEAVLSFAQNEDAWLREYIKAWSIATQNGYSQLHGSLAKPEQVVLRGTPREENGSYFEQTLSKILLKILSTTVLFLIH